MLQTNFFKDSQRKVFNLYVFMNEIVKFIKNSAFEGITAARAVHSVIYSQLESED
jgi:hypothetical protein